MGKFLYLGTARWFAGSINFSRYEFFVEENVRGEL